MIYKKPIYKRNSHDKLKIIISLVIVILFVVTNLGALTVSNATNNGALFQKDSTQNSIIRLLANTTSTNSSRTLNVGFGPIAVITDPTNNHIYVANIDSNNVSVINGANNTVIDSINVGHRPDGLSYDATNNYIYVANYVSDNVSVINGANNTVIDSINVGFNPIGVAYDTTNNYIYVTNTDSNNVSVINGANNTVIDSINVGYFTKGITYDSSNNYIYVANRNSNNVSVINGANNTVIDSINVGYQPNGIEYDTSNHYIYVANWASDNVSVINGANNTVIDSINVGPNPICVVYDSSNNYVYATDAGSDNIALISGATNTVVNFTNVGPAPNGVAYNSLNTNIYIANYGSKTVSIVPSLKWYPIVYTESGLLSGTSWSVTLSGKTEYSTTSTIVFSELNGTYSYTVNSVSGYTTSVSSSSITVNGVNVTKAINFSPLPPPVWAFKGAYINYIVAITNKSNFATTNLSVRVIAVNSSNDTVEISTNAAKNIDNSDFNETSYCSWNYTHSPFVIGETELLQLNNGTFLYNNSNFNVSTSLEVHTTAGVFIADEIYGTIDGANISVYYDMYSGTLLMESFTNSTFKGIINITSTNIPESNSNISYYPVTFTETGLPAGTVWYVNLTNGVKSGPITASSHTFYLSNGTYAYTHSSINTYYARSGNLIIDGSFTHISINYQKEPYIKLSVNPYTSVLSINGYNQTLVNGTIEGYIPQGYYYITATHPGYKPYTNLVHLSLNGTYTYNITLKQVKTYGYLTGTVLPGNATVTANGMGIPVTDGYFNVSLAPGTYYITVTAPGYNGNISVEKITQNRATSMTVTLSKVIKTVTLSGYISQANASLTVNGMSAYVNSTGYYDISVPSGNVVISAYETGYYPDSKIVDLTSSTMINITLIREPKATSTETVNNTVTSGYNVKITNLTTKNGYISMNYNATVNGTITVLLPFNEIRNATISDILSSRVYIDGLLYKNFSITVTSNGSAVLTVYNLAGDPTLYWKYSPDASLPSYYNITFTETGLPSGTSWSVTLNGVKESSTASTIVFSELNGTYTYTVNSVSGYTVSPSSGSITVNGKDMTQAITFTHNPVKKTSFVLSPFELYAIIGAVIAIAAIGGAAIVLRRRR